MEPETGEMLSCINGQVDRISTSYHGWSSGHCQREVKMLPYFLLLPRTLFITSDLILTKYFFQSYTAPYSKVTGFALQIKGAECDVPIFIHLIKYC